MCKSISHCHLPYGNSKQFPEAPSGPVSDQWEQFRIMHKDTQIMVYMHNDWLIKVRNDQILSDLWNCTLDVTGLVLMESQTEVEHNALFNMNPKCRFSIIYYFISKKCQMTKNRNLASFKMINRCLTIRIERFNILWWVFLQIWTPKMEWSGTGYIFAMRYCLLPPKLWYVCLRQLYVLLEYIITKKKIPHSNILTLGIILFILGKLF